MAGVLEGVKCVCLIMFQQTPVSFSMMAEQIVKVHVELIAPVDGELHGIRLLRNKLVPEVYYI